VISGKDLEDLNDFAGADALECDENAPIVNWPSTIKTKFLAVE
jgi:hypothetical protein